MAKTRLELIGQIDNSIMQIGEAFERGFTEGKKKPEGAAASQYQVFRQYWEMLSFSNFQSLTELDAFYKAQKDSHSEYINLFCDNLKINRADITTSKKNMLLHLISVYHVFARQRYILANFPSDVTTEEFVKMVGIINSDYSVCNKAYEEVNFSDINMRLQVINCMLSIITIKLNTLNYPEHPIEFPEPRECINHSDILGVDEQLQKLPTVVDINNLTDSLARARKRKNTADIDTKIQEIVAYADIMRSAKAFLNAALLSQVKLASEASSLLTSRVLTIEQHLAVVNINERIFKLITLLSAFDSSENILSLAQKTKEICQSQLPLEKVTFGYESSVWSTLCDKINAALNDMHQNICQFLLQFKSPSLDQVVAHKCKVEQQLAELQKLNQSIQEKIVAIGGVEVAAVNALERIEKIIQIHIENDDEALKESLNFLRHHWGKLTLGGTGGAGAGIGLALLFALEPTKLGLLIAATVALGAGLGAGAGAAKDRFFPDASERQILLNHNAESTLSPNIIPKLDGTRPSS